MDPLANQPDVYDPHKIGVGDVIAYAGIDHVVRGTIVLDEGSHNAMASRPVDRPDQ